MRCWNLETSGRSENYLKSFDMWWWRKVEKISWNDRLEDAEVLHTVKEKRNVLHTINRKRITGLVTSCVGTAF